MQALIKTGKAQVANRRGRRGAVALEYILIAALVAIGLMGAFMYFRNTLRTGMEQMTDVAAEGIAEGIQEAKDRKSDTAPALKK